MTDAAQLINFTDLKSRGVTDRMIELLSMSKGEEVQPWIYHNPRPALLGGGEIIDIEVSHKSIASIYLRKGEEFNRALVHDKLAKSLRKDAHNMHSTINEANLMVMNAYQVLGCNRRFDEAHVVIFNAQSVMVYSEPKWRAGNEDTGKPYSLEYIKLALEPYVPTIIMPHVEKQIATYLDTWKEIYGVEPQLSAFAKKVEAGSKLFVVIGDADNAVQLQFNLCKEIDRDTLKASEYVLSIYKDFK
jgi:hypothetical protein